MNSITLLRWTLCAVLGFQAAMLLAAAPPPLLIALGLAEIAAAALFAAPVRRTTRAGAVALIAVLAAAIALHARLGEPPPPAFAVYLAAIWVVVRNDSQPTRGPA
jgi:hypothetical protein